MTAAAPTLTAGVEMFERSVAFTRGVLAGLPFGADFDLSAPTPCHRWTVGDLLEHLDDSLQALEAAAAYGHVDMVPAEYDDTVDPGLGLGLVDRVRRRTSTALGAWVTDTNERVTVADASLCSATLVAVGALEVAVHGTDLARAAHLGLGLPDDLADELLAVAPLLVTGADRGIRFAPAAPTSYAARPAQRLLAYTGRHCG
ncbi:MAG TPA: TIGR03086 family metal-binding protein [Flexivirga sp.]|uniref:TIGR03086 family metal-binding protein n=1 Tax=Flexivirga sp. TaxID=1962927 RepID=UPI002CC5E227|nr:TIGR03086 family metal-binding protein [Flexivirga sp.]HWC24672.1 TIGR03086 family metal-binding protein [Flexivirga sp.]